MNGQRTAGRAYPTAARFVVTAIACGVVVVYGGAPSPIAQGHSSGASDQHRPDPCEQIFDVPGQANGLKKQCEGKGGGAGVAKGDFNGDGFADLAVGSPFENVANVSAAGAVHILYGSAAGLTATGNQLWSELAISSGNGPEASDLFGLTLASGDFNGDGFSDVAIGVPFQNCGSLPDCGAVHVLYGSSSGLTTTGRQYFPSTSSARMGAALVWADFNGDGFGDLAIGLPRVDRTEFFAQPEVGAVEILFGSSSGLTTVGAQFVRQGQSWVTPNVAGGDDEQGGDHFGSVLAAGDINGDGYHDLIVGVPDEDFDLFTPDTGQIHVIFGSPSGLGGFQVISQGTTGVNGTPESYDRMGWSLAVGDFNNDGHADVAVGVPFEDIGSVADAGAVQIFYGSGTGLRTDNDQSFDQSDFNNTPEAGDHFGWSLAAGKFDAGNYADLAIGSPGEDSNRSSGYLSNVGIVLVVKGSSTGLQNTTGVEGWILGGAGITQQLAAGDQFGYSLTAWNFGNGDRADLVIGIPYRDVTLSTGTVVADAGALLVLYGQSTGLTTSGYQFWTLASSGVLGSPQTSGRFGYALY
jgi:hypothetical protein